MGKVNAEEKIEVEKTVIVPEVKIIEIEKDNDSMLDKLKNKILLQNSAELVASFEKMIDTGFSWKPKNFIFFFY
mgnify:CR=1 FL=1